MSKIIEPQILSNNQEFFVTKDLQGNVIKPKLSGLFSNLFQIDNGQPYVFLKDFSFIHSTTDGSDGSTGSTMVNYKKDQVVYPFPSSPNVRMMRNPAFTKAIDEGVLVKQNIVAKVNKADNVNEKYRVNKNTKIYRINPNKKDILGDIATDIVGNLKKGDIITVVKKGFGGRGIAPTPFLYLKDDTYIYGYDADLLSEDEVSKIEKNKNLTTIVLLILVGLLAYKLVKK